MHIRRHGDGYRVIVKVNGRQRTATARTRAEAERKGAVFVLELGGTPKATAITVGELLAHWQNTATLSVTYRADIESVIGKLPASFASRYVASITPAIVEHTYADLAAKGWSAHRIRRLHSVLSSAWKMAQRYEWATNTPFAVARKPAVDHPDVRPPSRDELLKVLAVARPTLALYLRLSAAIGARRGEVVALQWGDLKGTQLIVRRSLATSSAAGTVVTEGKTGRKGQRVVAITDMLAHQLRAHHAEQTKLARRSRLPAPVWMFSHDAGVSPWRPAYVSLEFRRLCARAGVEGVRLHDLRHLMATEMLAAGVPLRTVASRLGHTKLATTADVYSHYVPAADQEATDALERRLDLG